MSSVVLIPPPLAGDGNAPLGIHGVLEFTEEPASELSCAFFIHLFYPSLPYFTLTIQRFKRFCKFFFKEFGLFRCTFYIEIMAEAELMRLL